MDKKKSSINKNTWWDRFCLRCQLLWIWFLKNLSLMLKIGIIIIAILVATNVIGSEDFIVQILGFADLQQIDWASVKGIENAVAIVISAIITALLIITKTRRLAIEDIKSRNLKIALIKAKLYFNEEGKLCKRTEELVDIDLNEDGKIGDTEIKDIPNENIITGVVRAVDELKTVLTTDLHEKETVVEEEELHDEISEEVEETEIGLSDNHGAEVETKTDEESEETVEETPVEAETEEVKEEEVKPKKPNIFSSSWASICKMFNNLKSSVKSMKDPKLDDGMESKKKKEKVKKPKKEKKARENKNKVEFVDGQEDTSDLLDKNEVVAEKAEVVQEEKQIVKQSERIDNKAQQINNILNNLK